MSRRYCFTLNNWTPQEETALADLDHVKYLVYGRETGESGTPHLQGFVIFDNSISLQVAKQRIGNRAHLEVARGKSSQAADYCKKDGDFVEYGELPSQQGKRSDWDVYRDWIEDLGRVPSRKELVLRFPKLYARYKRACFDYAEALAPSPVLTQHQPRFGWQTRVAGIVAGDASDRVIHFVIDKEGNSGKSWMCKYLLTSYPDRTQVLRIGKRDDLAYSIDIDKDIFLFDIPRTQMAFLQYSVLESLKDRMIFSPKYESSFKILQKTPHVVVFCNEDPDMEALSADRYNLITI